MAKTEAGNGKGISKPILTAEEQNQIRRNAKQNRRNNRRGGRGSHGTTTSILEEVQQDRAAAREEARLAAIDAAHSQTLTRLQSFGNQQVPGYASLRPRWTVNAMAMVEQLLHLYFFGPADEIEVRESLMGHRVVGEVRRRFAGACHFDRKVKGTPGQEQSWYAEALADTVAFHSGRREARKGTKNGAQPSAPATAEATTATVAA